MMGSILDFLSQIILKYKIFYKSSIIIKMSEYQSYFFSEDDRQENYSILNSSCIEDNRMNDIHFSIDYQKEAYHTNEAPTQTSLNLLRNQNEIVSDIKNQSEIIPDSFIEDNFNSATHGKESVIRSIRVKRKIQTDYCKIQKRKQVFKGLKDDTTQLNINLKTILVNKFKDMILSRQLGKVQKVFVQQFDRGIASFASIKKLIRSQIIREKVLKFISSSRLARDILKSQSWLGNKMTLVKYLQCAKLNFEKENITKWKQIAFYQVDQKQ